MFSDLDSYHLKDRLVENEDFMLVPAEAWHKLLAWYGMVDGQPPLERKVTLSRYNNYSEASVQTSCSLKKCVCVCEGGGPVYGKGWQTGVWWIQVFISF